MLNFKAMSFILRLVLDVGLLHAILEWSVMKLAIICKGMNVLVSLIIMTINTFNYNKKLMIPLYF